MSANDRKIIHEYNSIPQHIIRLVSTSLIACACLFLSWLAQSALVSLVVRDHASTNSPLNSLCSLFREVQKREPLSIASCASNETKPVRQFLWKVSVGHETGCAKILAMVCHFYPGLDWNRLGLKGDPSTYHIGKGL